MKDSGLTGIALISCKGLCPIFLKQEKTEEENILMGRSIAFNKKETVKVINNLSKGKHSSPVLTTSRKIKTS